MFLRPLIEANPEFGDRFVMSFTAAAKIFSVFARGIYFLLRVLGKRLFECGMIELLE